jgi:hypothetical protein
MFGSNDEEYSGPDKSSYCQISAMESWKEGEKMLWLYTEVVCTLFQDFMFRVHLCVLATLAGKS